MYQSRSEKKRKAGTEREGGKTEMKTITDQIKKAIWDVLKENSTADCVTLQPIPQKLRNVHGIEWKEYVENIGPGEFKRWLLSMFPLIEDPKNGNRVFLSESAAAAAVKAEHTLDGAAAEKIEGILRANLNAEGYLLNSEIPHLLEKEENGGIKWRDLAGSGATLGRWIENTFPVFRVDTEGKAPCIRLKHTQEYGPEGNTQGREYPVSFDPESVDSASEIQDMHTAMKCRELRFIQDSRRQMAKTCTVFLCRMSWGRRNGGFPDTVIRDRRAMDSGCAAGSTSVRRMRRHIRRRMRNCSL